MSKIGDTGETGDGARGGSGPNLGETEGIGGFPSDRVVDIKVATGVSCLDKEPSAPSGLAIRRPPKDLDRLRSFSIAEDVCTGRRETV